MEGQGALGIGLQDSFLADMRLQGVASERLRDGPGWPLSQKDGVLHSSSAPSRARIRCTVPGGSFAGDP